MSSPIIILAAPRSGTHAVRNTLRQSVLFADCGEIFHPNNKLYWPFLRTQLSSDPSYGKPTREHRDLLFRALLEELDVSSAAYSLIDVKYSSTHHFNLVWHDPTNPPYLLWLIKEHKIPVIHMVRVNDFLAAVSELLAKETGVYVTRKANIHERTQVTLDPELVLRNIRIRRRQKRLYRRWLRQTRPGQVAEVIYEQLLNPDAKNELSRQVVEGIARLCGSAVDIPAAIPIKKIVTRPLRELIENYHSELTPALEEEGLLHLVPPEE